MPNERGRQPKRETGEQFMNLEQFRAHIKTVDHATLDGHFEEISAKLRRAHSPARRLGYSLALDELAIESNLRKLGPIDAKTAAMTVDELYDALRGEL